MKGRPFWIDKIERLWRQRSIVWLSGVRRIGKTTLCRFLPQSRYFNCDLPSVRRQLEDPEQFLRDQAGAGPLIFDEIHRLNDPSSLLKIAADELPQLKVLATGSSSLQATSKFRDALAGRKLSVHLTPVLWRETLAGFAPPAGSDDSVLDHRLLAGGFPEQLLAPRPVPEYFEEWMDSFFARDIQELFGVRNRSGFLELLELVCLRSAGQLQVTDLAKESRMSRPTVLSHLEAMEIAHVVTRLPPFHGGGHREIIRQPKLYAFDTGLVAHVRGWQRIRDTDRGHLWEHLVLDELRSGLPMRLIHYWRDKNRREIDFVIDRGAEGVDAIEAKVRPDAFDASALAHFRRLHPRGRNFLLTPQIEEPYLIRRRDLDVTVARPDQMGAP